MEFGYPSFSFVIENNNNIILFNFMYFLIYPAAQRLIIKQAQEKDKTNMHQRQIYSCGAPDQNVEAAISNNRFRL